MVVGRGRDSRLGPGRQPAAAAGGKRCHSSHQTRQGRAGTDGHRARGRGGEGVLRATGGTEELLRTFGGAVGSTLTPEGVGWPLGGLIRRGSCCDSQGFRQDAEIGEKRLWEDCRSGR